MYYSYSLFNTNYIAPEFSIGEHRVTGRKSICAVSIYIPFCEQALCEDADLYAYMYMHNIAFLQHVACQSSAGPTAVTMEVPCIYWICVTGR